MVDEARTRRREPDRAGAAQGISRLCALSCGDDRCSALARPRTDRPSPRASLGVLWLRAYRPALAGARCPEEAREDGASSGSARSATRSPARSWSDPLGATAAPSRTTSVTQAFLPSGRLLSSLVLGARARADGELVRRFRLFAEPDRDPPGSQRTFVHRDPERPRRRAERASPGRRRTGARRRRRSRRRAPSLGRRRSRRTLRAGSEPRP